MSKFLHYCYLHNIVGLRTQTPFSYKSLDLVEPLRVSLYNGISIEDVKYLIKVMRMFTFCKDYDSNYESDQDNSCGSSICDENYIRGILSNI